MFKNRQDAGEKLAKAVEKLSLNPKDTIILALPRGGVVVGAKTAEILGLPLDIIVTRKIGHPFNDEYAVAAAGLHSLVKNPAENIDKKYLKSALQKERQEILRRQKIYRGNIPFPNLKNKTIILIDDGLATGLTMEAAILEVKNFKPKKIILAVPVAPPETLEKLKKFVDDITVLEIEPNFFAIGQFYREFSQTPDEEVVKLLRSFKQIG